MAKTGDPNLAIDIGRAAGQSVSDLADVMPVRRLATTMPDAA